MDKKINFAPLGARVLVTKYKEEVKESYKEVGGLLIPAEEDKNLHFKMNSGRVLAIGSTFESKAEVPVIKIGTMITFSNPHTITYDGTEYYLVHEDNIELYEVEG